jgi:hypothetical protein
MDVFFPDFKQIAQQEFVAYKDNGYGNSVEDGIGIGLRPDSSDNDLTNMVLNVDWTVGELTVTSVTGWSEYQYIDGADVDWLPLQFISRDDDQTFEQFSQEIRIASPGGEFFDYVAGAYYDQSDLEFDRNVAIDTNFDGLFPQFIAGALGIPAAARRKTCSFRINRRRLRHEPDRTQPLLPARLRVLGPVCPGYLQFHRQPAPHRRRTLHGRKARTWSAPSSCRTWIRASPHPVTATSCT